MLTWTHWRVLKPQKAGKGYIRLYRYSVLCLFGIVPLFLHRVTLFHSKFDLH